MLLPMDRARLGFTSLATALLALAGPAAAHAGMPSIDLTDLARSRIEAISFFVFLLLVVALLVKLLWNYLGKDFRRLPRISYGRALAGVTLWGLLFLLILTMISGARELMTPGAWEKHGATYELKDRPK
jgi:hypothetical protein